MYSLTFFALAIFFADDVKVVPDPPEQSEAVPAERIPPPIPIPPLSVLPREEVVVTEPYDKWGWRAGLPDVAPAGWYATGELRFLRGYADLENQNRNAGLGSIVAPRVEFGGRNGDSFGGALALGYLGAINTSSDLVRRRFESAGADVDLLIPEVRPLRAMRLNSRVGLGVGWLAYRRHGGGDPTANAVPVTDAYGPLVHAGAAAGSIAVNNVLLDSEDIDLDFPESNVVGTAANPRDQQVFGRSFTGAVIHAGLDDSIVIGRSGTALFAACDLRAVGGVKDSALAVSAKAGVRAFRKIGRYRVQFSGGYCLENWWLYQSAFDSNIGSDSMAAFRFHGPFGEGEVKF